MGPSSGPETTPSARAIAGVVLAAGAGTRLAPLTRLRPKALCPVGGVPLVDLALRRLASTLGPSDGPVTDGAADDFAVNVHHGAEQMVGHLAGRVRLSLESPVALGTAGALGALREWIGDRDVLVTNADSYLPNGAVRSDGERFTDGWDGKRCRLACVPIEDPARADFRLSDGRGVRYVGVALLPGALVRGLAAVPSGLYEAMWREQEVRGALDLRIVEGPAIDCGSVADYLRANLHASGGRSVIGSGARVDGETTRSVVWDGAHVGAGEHLVDVVRACRDGLTLTVGAGASPDRTDRSARRTGRTEPTGRTDPTSRTDRTDRTDR